MRKIHVGMLLASALVAGCAGFTGQGYVDDLNAADISGTTFTDALARNYRDLANFEWAEMLDYKDGQHYAMKGLAAAGGEAVAPDLPGSRRLPSFSVADITEAHTRLSDVLASGAGTRAPELAAKAQASFDCWIEQQEENHQPDHISNCRGVFEDAMMQLGPGKYLVFFNSGSSQLTRAAGAIIKQAVRDAKERGIKGFAVVGHTDTQGNDKANKALSMARAKAVKAALAAHGIKARNITISGEGESAPMVPTADGVKEASNRRAEISYR